MPTLEKKVELNLGDDVVILPSFDRAGSRGTVLSKTPKPLTMFLVKCGARRADFYLLDRHHERMGIVETMKAIDAMAAKKWPKARGILRRIKLTERR